MLIARLVQNYYERNGSFKGIEITTIVEILRGRAAALDMSLSEFCYHCLGYEATHDVILGLSYNAEEVKEIRALWADNDISKLKEMFEVRTAADVKMVLTNLGIPTKSLTISKKSATPRDLVQIVDALANYYKLCSTEVVVLQGKTYPFYVAIEAMKVFQKNVGVDDILYSEDFKPALATFSGIRGIKSSYIANNVVCTRKAFTAETQMDIQRHAIQKLINGSVIPKGIVKRTLDLPLMSAANPKVYLQLLDIAAANKMTYAELIGELGIFVPDLFHMFERTDLIAVKIADNIYYTDWECTKEMPFKTTDVLTFSIMIGVSNNTSRVSSMEVF